MSSILPASKLVNGGGPGLGAINRAYGYRRELGEDAMIRLAGVAAWHRDPWWRWATFLAAAMHIEWIRRERFGGAGSMTMPVEVRCELDPKCPLCGEHSDVGEIFDGGEHDCGNCGKYLTACAFEDGTMQMVNGGGNGIVDLRSGRKKTRARWRRQGRR